MTAKEHRRRIPDGVRLQALLLMLGVPESLVLGKLQDRIKAGLDLLGIPEGVEVQWDHDPALGLRGEAGGILDPHPNDPRFVTPRVQAGDHDRKTNGTKATTAGSDKQRIAKTKRLEERRLAELLAPAERRERPKKKSRPMPGGRASGLKRKMNGRTERR